MSHMCRFSLIGLAGYQSALAYYKCEACGKRMKLTAHRGYFTALRTTTNKENGNG